MLSTTEDSSNPSELESNTLQRLQSLQDWIAVDDSETTTTKSQPVKRAIKVRPKRKTLLQEITKAIREALNPDNASMERKGYKEPTRINPANGKFTSILRHTIPPHPVSHPSNHSVYTRMTTITGCVKPPHH